MLEEEVIIRASQKEMTTYEICTFFFFLSKYNVIKYVYLQKFVDQKHKWKAIILSMKTKPTL